MKKLCYLLVTLLPALSFGQQTPCSCGQVLDRLISKVEAEYPGFSAKTKETFLYNGFKENLTKQVKQADSLACQKILKQYIDFFEDPHLWVGANGAPFISGTTMGKAASIAIDLKEFQNQVAQTKDTLEGVWKTDGYRIGVKRLSKNEYVGFIIEAQSPLWKPKEIKFRLLANGTFEYALRDKTLKTGNFTLYKEGVLFLSGVNVALAKESPLPINEAVVATRLNELEGFYFKKLTAKTAMLKLPSFEYQYLEQLSKLIEDHKTQLENSENLIVDLRGNPGGTTDAYQKLLPYIMGKSIRNTGAEFLATQTYINHLEAYKKSLDKGTPTVNIDQNIATLKANLGQFVNFNVTGQPIYIENVSVAEKSPRHVVILADKGSGSSAEYFLFVAKQSKKVKILGVPSYGALDYGNAYLNDLACSGYQLFMPTYRALRLPDYPIDHIGIQPDVYLDKSVKDWVAFAVKYLEE